MTNFEYARRIDEAAGLDLSLDCKEIDLQDKLYGIFQCFMPDGAGVDAVFAPLQNGTELQARIMPIYVATAQQTREAFDQGMAPGYFCPPQDPKFDDEALKSLALAHVRNLKIFAEFLGKSELLKMLGEIKSARVQEGFDFAHNKDELAHAVYEAITEWMIDTPKLDAKLWVARRGILFDQLRLSATCVLAVSKLRAKAARGLFEALLRAVSSGTADRV